MKKYKRTDDKFRIKCGIVLATKDRKPATKKELERLDKLEKNDLLKKIQGNLENLWGLIGHKEEFKKPVYVSSLKPTKEDMDELELDNDRAFCDSRREAYRKSSHA